MTKKRMKKQINLYLVDNAVTKDDKDDKIFEVQSQGSADIDDLVSEMMKVNPGLEEETIRMVLSLEVRVTMDLLLSGVRVNNGMYVAELQCKGVTYDGTWNPDVNSLYVSFAQTKELRESLKSDTVINIVGEKGAAMFVSGGESAIGQGFVVKAGRSFTLRGKNIKVAGDDPSVGITLTNATRTETRIEGDMIIQNDPSKLVFLIPAELEDGEYELKVTTQFTSGGVLLKSPRSVVKALTVGEAPDPIIPGGGGGEEDEGESPDPIV